MNDLSPNSYEEWQLLAEEHKKSGLTQKEFCKQKNISLVRFGYYLQRLRKQTQSDSSEKSPVFSQVLINKSSSETEVKIELPNGFKCTIPSIFPTEQLKKIICVLLSC